MRNLENLTKEQLIELVKDLEAEKAILNKAVTEAIQDIQYLSFKIKLFN